MTGPYKPFDPNGIEGLDRDELHTIEADLDLFARLAAWSALGYTAFHLRSSEFSKTIPMESLRFDLADSKLLLTVGEGPFGEIISWEHDLVDVDELGPLFFTVLMAGGDEIIHLTATNDIEDSALDTEHGLDEIGRTISEHEKLLGDRMDQLRVRDAADTQQG